MTKLVVGGAFLGIAEHIVGFFDLIEPILGIDIVAGAVWMELHRQATIGLFQISLSGL